MKVVAKSIYVELGLQTFEWHLSSKWKKWLLIIHLLYNWNGRFWNINQTSAWTWKEELGKEVDHGPYKSLAFSIQMSRVLKRACIKSRICTQKGILHWGPTMDLIQTSLIWTNRMAWIFQIESKYFTFGPHLSFPSSYMVAYMAQKWRQAFGPTQGNWVKVWGGPVSQYRPNCLKFISTIWNWVFTWIRGLYIWRPSCRPKLCKTEVQL